MTQLSSLAPGIAAWIDPHTSNSAVVTDDDGLTVVDAMLSPNQALPYVRTLDTLGAPVKRLVATSSHIEYVGGSSLFKLAAVYGTAQISAHLDQPPNIDGCAKLFPGHASEFVDLTTRTVTHTVTEPAWISARAVAVPMTGELAENLVVQIPEHGLVLCGAMCSFGRTPLAFDGDPAAWADSLDTVLTYGSIFVPGHGPVGTAQDIADQQAYLRACAAANGEVANLGSGPWDTWTHREFDQINVQRAAMLRAGDPSPPPAMLRLLGLA